MTAPESKPNLLNGTPRPEGRIDELLGLLAEDWKASGSDQRFFQYIINLQHRLGLPTDSYNVEDTILMDSLRAQLGRRRDRTL